MWLRSRELPVFAEPVGVCPTMPHILTINAGSSSIRFALFAVGAAMVKLMDEKIERNGSEPVDAMAGRLVQKLQAKASIGTPDAIGHRVVHGMLHTQPERIAPDLKGRPCRLPQKRRRP